ncbi:MAG TPA: S-layer homology domain-containing protein [Firmicutes bacterium]|nr:S-layer homology domain-containing protein [Bacillota bacterium]
MELDLAWGLDGPTSNMYQNYEFSFYNVIELEEVKPLEPGEGNWKVSKSKTATPLDSNYQSKVTLSLPAADYEKSMDVVFVLDDTHAGSGIFAEAATTLLDELVSKKNLDIHVGIVSFDAAARDWLAATSDTYSGLVSLKDENAVEALKVAIGTELSSDGEGYQKRLGGTNTEWPLAMAQEMLSQGTGGEQHVIMFSDMYGYVYRGNLEVDGKTYENVPLSKINSGYELGQLCIAGPMYKSWEEVYNGQDEDKPEYDVFFRYRSGGSTASWDNYWTTFQGFDTAPTAPNKEDIVTTVWGETYFTPFEKSSCLTYDQVQELLANDVQVTIVNNNFDPGSAEIQTIKNQMLDALDNQGVEVIREDTANGSEFTSDQMSQVFATLEDKLIQLVDAGSRVEDVIGSDTDNKGAEYNFDFVDDASALQLTVGGVPYIVKPNTPESTENETACYLFLESQTAENASFVLHYYEKGKNGNSDECFVWDINVPVTKDMPVQLTYTVELMKPSEVSGTHGQYDEDGHAQYDSLKTNLEAILYPVDSNGTAGRPEKFYTPTVSYTVGAISIEPADITIYTGGDGYESAVEGSGDSEVGKTSNGLPEPGFYITLPDDVNQALIEKVEKTDPDDVTEVEIEENGTTVKQKVVDLSKYLKFTYEDEEGNKRLWELDRYDNQQGNTSMAYSRYIYRIKPSTIQDGEPIPIRLQFTDQENNISTTDDFEVNLDGLYQKYTMTIYAGDLNRGLVKAVVTVPGQEAEEYQAEVLEGDLTIRGVTDQNTMTTDVVKNENGPTEAVEDITAHVPEEAKFYINESQLEVADPESVKLLVDSIVEDENNTLHNEAIDEFAEITADHNVQLNYLDLVDESNGNAWVTTGKQPITVYWPYPEGTDKNDDFYIVHYEGLDRNDNEALENDRYTMELYSKDSKENGLETTDQGIRITVDSFSPFALFWEEDDIPVIDEPDGGDEDPIRYTLTYVSNGGTEYDPERYNANTVVQIDKQPIREGYTFEGWYLDEELTEPVDEVKMTRNITVYAKWEPTSVPGDLNGDDHFAYIIGRDDGYIHPTDNINRAEVAAIFFRLLKEDVRQANLTDTHSFNDVDADMWYNTSVATMAKMGIVTGDPDGSFRPEDSITRAEFAAIAARFDEIAYDGEDLFSDIAGHWAQEEINAAANNGWILGYTDGTFGPQKYITRAEAMTLVNRVLNRLPEDTSDLLDDMIRWPDNQDTNIWYYLAVQEATNSHDYERKSDGVHEKWTALNENEDWVKYQ